MSTESDDSCGKNYAKQDECTPDNTEQKCEWRDGESVIVESSPYVPDEDDATADPKEPQVEAPKEEEPHVEIRNFLCFHCLP